MIVEKSFDGATGTEVLLEAHVVVAGAASDVNGLAPAGRVNFKVASRTAQIFPGIPRIRDTTNDKIAHVADHPIAGLFDCKRAEAQVSHKDLAATISGMDSPGRLGVQDSDQAQAAVRFNRDQAAEQSFYAPKKNGGAPP